MDELNKQQSTHSFPNSDRPLDSKEPTKGPVAPANLEQKETVKFKDVMDSASEQFIHADPKLASIETYNTDVARAIRKDNVSALQIAMAEQRKQEERGSSEDVLSGNSNSWKLKIGGIVFLIVAVTVGYFLWSGFFNGKNTVPTQTIKKVSQTNIQASSVIKVDQKQIIPVDGKDAIAIKNILEKVKDDTLDPSSIREVILANQSGSDNTTLSGVGTSSPVAKLNTSDFLTALGTHTSTQLVRALSDNYTSGIYGSSPHEFFIIFNVKSYDNAYAGMLSWESSLEADLGDVFGRTFPKAPVVNTKNPNLMPATTTRTDITNQHVFADRIFYNKDTRFLSDVQGRTKMLYTFIDPKTLLVVSSEAGLREILSRLTTGRITR